VSLILRQRALEPFKLTETSDLDLNIEGDNRYVVPPNHIIGGDMSPLSPPLSAPMRTSDKHLVCAVVLKSGMGNGGHASSN